MTNSILFMGILCNIVQVQTCMQLGILCNIVQVQTCMQLGILRCKLACSLITLSTNS